MDCTKEESLEKSDMSDDNIPLWVTTLFEKMKVEICAEVHAKVAYSMRIMLDQFHEDLKLSLQSAQMPLKNDVHFCKEVDACKEKHAALCASCHHVMTKEEKKRMKRAKKEEKKIKKQQQNVSESDTDNEKNTNTAVNLPVPLQIPVPLQKYDPTKAPPVPPRKTSPIKNSVTRHGCSPSETSVQLNDDSSSNSELLAHLTDMLNIDRQELIDGPVEMLNMDERTFQLQVSNSGHNELATAQEKTTKSVTEDKLNNQANAVTEAGECLFSPSDSEFEVISMPHNILSKYAPLPQEMSPLMSDYDDSSNESFDTETEHEFEDCKQPSTDVSSNRQPNGSLYPELELKKMTLSIMSSSSSTILDGYMSCSTEGAVAMEPTPQLGVEIERERSPYSCPPEVVEKINRQEIVHSQPLPSEFLRDRKPYSHIPLEEPKQSPPQPTQSSQPKQVQEVTRPPRHNPRDSTYRVDNLPESLWDEALTVAAQTYNAAKTAVGTLADTFAPGVAAQSDSASPPPRPSPVRTQPAYRVEMAEKEQKLFEMGFLDHGLNATLLIRHFGDMDRVIAELIEP